jgi:clan AA aspartic protease (TIGR02281 family)
LIITHMYVESSDERFHVREIRARPNTPVALAELLGLALPGLMLIAIIWLWLTGPFASASRLLGRITGAPRSLVHVARLAVSAIIGTSKPSAIRTIVAILIGGSLLWVVYFAIFPAGYSKQSVSSHGADADSSPFPKWTEQLTANQFHQFFNLSVDAVNGDAQSQVYLCDYLFFDGIKISKAEQEWLFDWCVSSAKKGNSLGQYELAEAYRNGKGVARNYAEAIKWYRAAQQNGYPLGGLELGEMYLNGEGVSKNYVEAMKWFRLSGRQEAEFRIGEMYENGWGVKQDLVEAIKHYKNAAGFGPDGILLSSASDNRAQERLGEFAELWQNHNAALNFFRAAAENGNAKAQTILGSAYFHGWHDIITPDYGIAAKWYREAAQQGFGEAMYNLGVLYENGFGVPTSIEESIKWYQKAADQGNAHAELALGDLYDHGPGVEQDDVVAVNYYRKAAAQGDTGAQTKLGAMYNLGKGVPQNPARAYMWVSLGTATGEHGGTDLLDAVIRLGQMTPEEISQAQELARQCEASHYKQCGEPEDTNRRECGGSRSNGGETGCPSSVVVAMQTDGGAYVVPITINNVLTLKFVVDSGAADMALPADVVSTLMRTGALTPSDFNGTQTHVLADGSKVPSQMFNIRTVKVGTVVLENVTASVSPAKGELLLGQSFFKRFKSWSIDNTRHALVLQ